jgi:hypothetical protein
MADAVFLGVAANPFARAARAYLAIVSAWSGHSAGQPQKPSQLLENLADEESTRPWPPGDRCRPLAFADFARDPVSLAIQGGLFRCNGEHELGEASGQSDGEPGGPGEAAGEAEGGGKRRRKRKQRGREGSGAEEQSGRAQERRLAAAEPAVEEERREAGCTTTGAEGLAFCGCAVALCLSVVLIDFL